MTTPISIQSTPLVKAAEQNSLKRVKELLSAGYNPNEKNEHENSALAEAIFHGNIPMIKWFLQYGADVNARDGEGHNALFYVVAGMCPWQEVLPRFKLLFKYGIDLCARDKHGHNILQHGSRLDNATKRWLNEQGIKE